MPKKLNYITLGDILTCKFDGHLDTHYYRKYKDFLEAELAKNPDMAIEIKLKLNELQLANKPKNALCFTGLKPKLRIRPSKSRIYAEMLNA